MTYTCCGLALPQQASGVLVIFHHPGGTANSMAAPVPATASARSLFPLDRAAVVSKYLGETQKNLDHLLAHANAKQADVVLR